MFSKKKNRVNNSLHLWSEEISLVEECISLDSKLQYSKKIHYSTSGISSGSLDIHLQKKWSLRLLPGSDFSDKKSENSHPIFLKRKMFKLANEMEEVK